MKTQKNLLLLLCIFIFSGCASGYKVISPNTLNYQSGSSDSSVIVDYKYNLLSGRYAKREANGGIKLVSIKISNNSSRDMQFGKDFKLIYDNGSDVILVDNMQVYTATQQHPGIYLLYLLLTPFNLTSSSNGQQTSSTPIGYIVGPGLALGNMISASSANGNYKDELLKYNLSGKIIKSGTTVYGLIGIKSSGFERLKVKVN